MAETIEEYHFNYRQYLKLEQQRLSMIRAFRNMADDHPEKKTKSMEIEAIEKEMLLVLGNTQDVHSGRRNGALYGRKRRFTALIFTLFHRNPAVRITTAVSGRFSPVYSRFRPFTRRSVGPGHVNSQTTVT